MTRGSHRAVDLVDSVEPVPSAWVGGGLGETEDLLHDHAGDRYGIRP